MLSFSFSFPLPVSPLSSLLLTLPPHLSQSRVFRCSGFIDLTVSSFGAAPPLES